MRSAEQISRNVGEWHDHQRAERRLVLDALLEHLARARAERPEWYAWVTEGQPELTPEQYERVKARRRKPLASA